MRTSTTTIAMLILLAGTALSQGYQIEYEYDLGSYASVEFELEPTMIPEYFDLNGDGNMEIVIRDGLDQTEDLLVFIDGATYSEIWSYHHVGSNEISFKGTMDLDGDQDKELLVGSYGEVSIIDYPSGATIASIPKEGNIVVYDFDSDGLPELIVNTAAGVQVWGWDSGTSGVPELPAPGARLDRNRPNPFNPGTVIAYQVQSAGVVRLEILDLKGRMVRALVDGYLSAGEYETAWDGLDDHGGRVPSGAYLYMLRVADFTASRKLVLLK